MRLHRHPGILIRYSLDSISLKVFSHSCTLIAVKRGSERNGTTHPPGQTGYGKCFREVGEIPADAAGTFKLRGWIKEIKLICQDTRITVCPVCIDQYARLLCINAADSMIPIIRPNFICCDTRNNFNMVE